MKDSLSQGIGATHRSYTVHFRHHITAMGLALPRNIKKMALVDISVRYIKAKIIKSEKKNYLLTDNQPGFCN